MSKMSFISKIWENQEGERAMTCKWRSITNSPYSKGKLPQCLLPKCQHYWHYITEKDCIECDRYEEAEP